jgi:hypothetical protein
LTARNSIRRELIYGAKFRKAPIPNGANPEEREIPNVAKGAKGEKWRPPFAPFAQYGISRRLELAPFGIGALRDFPLFRLCVLQALRPSAPIGRI